MKLPPARLTGFLRAPDAATRAALVYGPDNGLVRERADALAAAICPDRHDPFRISDLTAAALSGDPSRLNDEAAAMSLTGGRRIVRLREAGDAVAGLCERFLAAPPPGDSLVVVEGGDLPARSRLRKVFEAAKNAVAIACYADGPREIEALIREVLGAESIAVTPEAMQYLVRHLGGDHQLSRRELEKLALYAGAGGRVDEAAALAAIGDSAALSIDDVVYAAADGATAALDRALTRAFQEGEEPVTLLRALIRHFQRLHLVGARLAKGMGEEEALRALSPPIFFKLADRFKQQLRLWPPARVAASLDLLTRAEGNAKTTVLPAETICRAALLRIAVAAAGRSR